MNFCFMGDLNMGEFDLVGLCKGDMFWVGVLIKDRERLDKLKVDSPDKILGRFISGEAERRRVALGEPLRWDIVAARRQLEKRSFFFKMVFNNQSENKKRLQYYIHN